MRTQLGALHSHYRPLLEGITDPEMFGAELFSKKLITSLVLKDSITVGIPVTEKISMLLQGIESAIGLDPNCFDELRLV